MSGKRATDTLVGRDAELAELRAALRRARDGAGGLLSLVGPAGIGKSALAEATAAAARLDGFEVAVGRALGADRSPRLSPLGPCLRDLGLLGHPALAANADDTAAFGLWEQTLSSLAASDAPARLWIVEDVHAADAATLELLLFLSRSLSATRTLLLLTARDRDLALTGLVRQRVNRLLLDSERILLAALAPEAAASLAARWGKGLAPADVTRLVARAGGNPLFVRECALAVAAGRRAPGGGPALPDTIVAAVQERVDGLPRETQRLLKTAAVLSDDVRASMLAAMTDALPARAIDDLAPAVTAGLLDELEPGEFRFSHALVREAIERGMSAEERSLTHARAEAALAARGEVPQLLPERARHALASLAPDRAASTARLVADAVAVLERSGSFDRAFALAAQALSAREAGTLPPARPEDLARGAALARAAGKQGEHRRLALAAIAAARAAGDAPALARAGLVLGAELRPGVVDPALVQALDEARDGLGADEAPLACRVRARLAAALQPAPHVEVPMAMARSAIAEARRLGDESLLCDVLHDASAAFVDVGDPSEVASLNRELAAVARARRDPERALRASMRLALAELEIGHFEAFADHVDDMLIRARAVGHPRLTWRPLLFASMRSTACGRFEESEALVTEVDRLDELGDDPGLFVALRAHRQMRAQAMHRRDEVHDSLSTMAENLDRVPESAFMHPVLAALAAARFGEPVSASAGGPSSALFNQSRSTLVLTGILGEIAAAGGSDGQRAQLRARLLPHAGQELAFGQLGLSYEGPVERVIGLLDASLGDRRAAADRLAAARERCRQQGLLPWVARIGFELGQILTTDGARAQAATAVDEAAEIAGRLGLASLADRARQVLAGRKAPRAAIGRSRSKDAEAPEPALTLSREGDVWLLRFGEQALRVRDSRGMALVARLVERPREEIHVLVLAGAAGESAPESTAGPALDDEATRAYRARLREIDGDLEAAEAAADLGGGERLRRERGFLEQELARGLGLGGRARPIGSASERARINVQRRIKDALAHVSALDPSIGTYLRSAIRTGTFCSFRP